jgi:diketogulonate reductase-like aldo/keto reductase
MLTRRKLNALCGLLGLSPASMTGMLPSAVAGVASRGPTRFVEFPNGTVVPALGQGSARLGQGRHPRTAEEEALRTGISLGMMLIDTAEIYGNGESERLIGRVIADQRDRVFVVSKVWPGHVGGVSGGFDPRAPGQETAPSNGNGNSLERACEGSLARLGTDYLDLLLLHWPSGVSDLSGVVTAFENLRSAGKIRAWGVSNFKVSDMERLFRVPDGYRCATNQVPYNLVDRGIETDLQPWCEQHQMPLMAYSPLGGADSSILRAPILARIGAAHGCSPVAVALAWTIRTGRVIAIPESGSVEHVKQNVEALSLTLSADELQALDVIYPPPSR